MRKRFRRVFGRHDGRFNHQQIARHLIEVFEREYQVLEMIDKSKRQRDVEFADAAARQLIDIHPAVFNVEAENFAHKDSLADVLALAVDAEDPSCAATLGLNSIKAGVA